MQVFGPRLSTLGTLYTAVQVQALLADACAIEDWQFVRCSPTAAPLSDVSQYVLVDGSTLSHDSARAIKRVWSGHISSKAGFDWQNDMLQVYYRTGSPDGGWISFLLGTLVFVQTERGTKPEDVYMNVSAADSTQLMADSTFRDSITINAGANIVAAALAIMRTVLPDLRHAIPPSPRVMPVAVSWDARYDKLTIINDLFWAVNYQDLWCDERGLFQTRPIVDYSLVQPTALLDGTNGVIGPDITEARDSSSALGNQILFDGVDARQGINVAYYENRSVDSPISLYNHRPKLHRQHDARARDPVTVQMRAKEAAQKYALKYGEMSVTTLAWPLSQDQDVYQLAYTDPNEGLKLITCLEAAWSMVCQPGQLTEHTLQRIVSV